MTAYLSPADAATELSASKDAILAAIRRGDLPAFKDGRLVRIRREDWDDYLTRHTTKPAATSRRRTVGAA
jgi:excisionase family DNA binding protein